MRKIAIAISAALLLIISTISVVSASPPNPACNGLDVAHAQVHGSGTQGELALHDLRGANHCSH